MNNWKYKCNIQNYINIQNKAGDTFESVVICCNNIASKIISTIPEYLVEQHCGLSEDLDYMLTITVTDAQEVFRGIDSFLDEMNGRLNILYDFADENNIWLGK